MSLLNRFSDCKDVGFYKNRKRVHVKRNNMSFDFMFLSSLSHQSVKYGGRGRGSWWFSNEDETKTLFSSRTLSSSESVRQQYRDGRRTRVKSGDKVEDSFEVVKSSDDRYTAFRASMVEMIVERKIFEAEELEKLLQCFLLLSSQHHHRTIIKVFTDICRTLFSNWS